MPIEVHRNDVFQKLRLQHFFQNELDQTAGNGFFYDYLYGDLDDFFFQHCTWILYTDQNGSILEVLLVYSQASIPTVLCFYRTSEETMSEMVAYGIEQKVIPEQFYCHYWKSLEQTLIRSGMAVTKFYGTHCKMFFKGFTEQAKMLDVTAVQCIGYECREDVKHLFEESYPDNWFSDHMLQTNKYFGVRDSFGKLICIAGLHVYSKEFGIATLGNITTHPNHRGKGVAKRTTVLLLRNLLSDTNKNGELLIKYIALNVRIDNKEAIKCYEWIGFVPYCQFEESLFSKN